MAKAKLMKSPQKRSAKRIAKAVIDPRQMGLFDTLEATHAAPARMQRAKAAKQRPETVLAAPRPVVLSAREAAHYLGVSVSTLKNWRAKKLGPKWTMRGARLIAYGPADLEHFLEQHNTKR